jgi:molecular chaperone DnaK (HSP70)
VVQGEDEQPVTDTLTVGQRQLDLPPRPPGQPSLEVTMGYDSSGMVKVTVKDLISSKQEDITIDFYQN